LLVIFFSPLFYSVFFEKAIWEDSIVINYISFVFDTISRMISSKERSWGRSSCQV
jgi:hypothetical protein